MIVATAGHVDHGKTLLVKQLTGVETDRLAEEQRRGLSIDLGFAYQTVSGGKTLGFIDVPGHSRFINNMISGISGIDLGLIVVAADDGPMPQTREHLDVLRLLGVRDYAVVVTKIDRVSPARVEIVKAAIADLMTSMPATGPVPQFEVSNTEGTGIAELQVFLKTKAESCRDKDVCGNFRLSVDRAFTLKGVGLVVAGTIISGEVSVGDTLRLEPQGVKVRVRGLHAHGAESRHNIVGERCALNIVGPVEKDTIERGDWLLAPAAMTAERRFDARFTLRGELEEGLRNLTPVTLHIGAKKEKARITALRGKAIAPGESTLVQVISDRPIACCRGDRFLIRNDGEDMTLGGGEVLDPGAPSRGKSSASRQQFLDAMNCADAATALARLVLEYEQIVDLDHFKVAWNLRDEELAKTLGHEGLQDRLKQVAGENRTSAVSLERWNEVCAAFVQALDAALKRQEDTAGIPYQKVQAELAKSFAPALIEQAFKTLVREGKVVAGDGQLLRLPQRQVQFSRDEDAYWQPLRKYLTRADTKPPALQVIAEELNLPLKSLRIVAMKAVKLGELVQVSDTRFVLPKLLAGFASLVLNLGARGPFSIVDFKDRAGIGRTLAVEILEFFDRIGFTARRENARILLDKSRAERFSR